jgi:hypothetical protein
VARLVLDQGDLAAHQAGERGEESGQVWRAAVRDDHGEEDVHDVRSSGRGPGPRFIG